MFVAKMWYYRAMKKHFISWVVIGMSVLEIAFPVSAAFAFASTQSGGGLKVPPPPTGKIPQGVLDNPRSISNLFCGVLDWVFWGLIVFSIIMFLVGGYRYATSSGEPEKVQTANKILLYAAIAIAVALVAEGIPYLVGSFLGSGFGASVC